MSDALRRAIRTFVMTFLAFFVGTGVLSAMAESGVVDWEALKKAGISAAFAAIAAVISFAVNWLEDNTAFPALLKAPASSGENPVPADADPAV